MSSLRYILRSLVHHRFAYLGVLAGAVLGATVLLGALFAGDSIAASLRELGRKRIGRTTHILAAGDRFFREKLAEDLAAAANVSAAPILLARGTATVPSTRAAANQVQLVGVTAAFWKFAPTPTAIPLDPAKSTVAVNDTLARRLQIKSGDTLVVRTHKPGILAGNAPVAGAESSLQSLRCTVAAIVDDAAFGRFSLDATQIPPPSIFLPIELLQERFERPKKANLLLLDTARSNTDLARSLASVAQLADYGLTLKWIERAAAFEVASERIFLDPEVAEAVLAAIPGTQPVVSYLVNEYRVRDRTTPYSIATATTPAAASFLPADLGPREIVLNDWLAQDLQAVIGDTVRLTYFQVGAADALVEQSAEFRVRAVVPLEGLAADRAWMPDFPGISDVSRPSDWNPGLPLKLDRIRPTDERYWDEHRGAPKAFLSFAAGRELWSTRWGTQTALRIPHARDREAELVAALRGALRPEMNQLLIRDLRTSAEASAQSPVDFAGLFLGMSFFLIVAAIGLVVLLFQFTLLQRNRESALLGAVGVSARQLLRWRLAEGVAILLLGSAAGLALATLYTRGILRFLESIWAGQTATPTFSFAAGTSSIVGGTLIFLVLSLLAIWLGIRRQARRALSIRLAAHTEEIAPAQKIRRRSRALAAAGVFIAAAAIALSGRGLPAQIAFYLAGFSLLVAGIAAFRGSLARASDSRSVGAAFDPAYLAQRNLAARRSRSVAVVGLIATSVFMVLSVASFRKHVGDDWLVRESGTGGFALWIETTAGQNPSRDGRQGFELFERQAAELGEIVALRTGAGDNINCFNLNSSAQPQLLAVDAARLAARNAFTLKLGDDRVAAGWNALRTPFPDGAIPALIDATTLQWALKRKIGDTLIYRDENGRDFPVRIVGALPDSIFQGYAIVDEQAFLPRFPSHPGYSIFLADVRHPAGVSALRRQLEAGLVDVGGRVDLTRDVLGAFHQIENTYIAIFNVLGTLGVLLGSLGLAIVVARNVRERRGEFAVMSAIGIPRSVLARMVFLEFGRLVLWGIVVGALASALAVWPNVTTLPAVPTLLLVAGLLAGIVALNVACGWAIFRWSMRDLRPSLAQAAL